MAYGTDLDVRTVVCFDETDPITTTQAFGRAGRNRDCIEASVYAPRASVHRLNGFLL
jgi:hypothetical protein